ncbi:hypothetical protein MIR68_006233 [Amoeboaphelidium protococcarum]|nr:hypothetical protein MIR68_006233 [Amoeboaphelidium protococcarum]
MQPGGESVQQKSETEQVASDITRGAAVKAQQAAQRVVGRTRGTLMRFAGNFLRRLRALMQRYPPLASLITALFATSAVPVGIYSLFALATSTALGVVGLSVFGLVEGSLLAFSGLFLALVLSGCALFSLTLVGFISVVYLGMKVVRTVYVRTRHWVSSSQSWEQQQQQQQQQQYGQQGPSGVYGYGTPTWSQPGTSGRTYPVYGKTQPIQEISTPSTQYGTGAGVTSVVEKAASAVSSAPSEVLKAGESLRQAGEEARKQ